MDLLLVSVCVGAVVLVLVKLAMLIFRYISLCKKMRKFPQLHSHWLKGNLDMIGDPNNYMDTACQMAQKGHRMFCMWVGPVPICVVCHPETLKQVIQATNEKALGAGDGYRMLKQWIGDGLLNSKGRKWERNRKMLTPAFHFDILKGYISTMNKGADVLMDQLWWEANSGSSVEIMENISKATLETMLKCALSFEGDIQTSRKKKIVISAKEDHQYLAAVRRLNTLLWDRLLNPLLFPDAVFRVTRTGREFQKNCNVAQSFTRTLIKKRKQTLKSDSGIQDTERRHLDFLDILLKARDDDGVGLSDQEIQDEVDTFTFEGHDTTMSAISWCLHALANYPDIQELVYKDVQNVLGDKTAVTIAELGQFAYLNCFVKEVLRFYTPVPDVARGSDKPILVDGIEIPVGVRIDLCLIAIHHNPHIWTEPQEFRPERFDRGQMDDRDPYGFVPFSAGSRNCIGRLFALNEIKITVAKFVKRFQATLDPHHEVKRSVELVLSTKTGIKLNLQERNY